MHRTVQVFSIFCSLLFGWSATAQDMNSVAGQYKALLYHDGTDYYQHAKITLRTVNPDGTLRISANVRIFFGESDSNEFFIYEFDNVPLNLLTRQISVSNEANDVSMVGFLRDGEITGDWFSTLIGRVGTFEGRKDGYPEVPEEGILVQALSGHYRGTLTNENPNSNLPERVTFSFVTTQDTSGNEPALHVSGNTRLYLGEFNSQEYVELVFDDIQFNFYNRYLTAKTTEYGLTFKGTMNHDGTFEGIVFSDGVGEVGPVSLTKM